MGLASALSGPVAALLLAVAVSIVGVVNLVDLARRPPPPARGARATMWSRIRRCGLWPLLPILAWNLAFAGRLPPLFADDRAIPALILGVEMVGRVVVFGAPIVLVLGVESAWRRRGLVLHVGGVLIYLASWVPPLVDPTPSWLWLGPFVTPALWLAGLGLMARSRAYLVGAALFVLAHATHGALALAGAIG